MKIQLFNFNQSDIRMLEDESGQYWFSAKDISKVLNITWSGQTLAAIPKTWRCMLTYNTPSRGKQKITCITEAAVYKLAFRSNKPEADAFTNQVAELLVNLRKKGIEQANEMHSHLDMRTRYLVEINKLNRLIGDLQKKVDSSASVVNLKQLKTRRVAMMKELKHLDMRLGTGQLFLV